jgi:hypothetical protein
MVRGRLLVNCGLGLLGVAATWVGCSAGSDTSEGDTFTTPPTGSAGMGGGGGEGGAMLPCGIDCSEIQTDVCHRAICDTDADPPMCSIVPVEGDVECDDGLFCTIGDHCVDGICTPDGQNDCQLDPAPCQAVVCDEDAKSCTTETLPNGTDCVSTDLCIVAATCTNGLCLGPTNDCFFAPVPSLCHVAVCNPASGDCDPVPGHDGFQCIDYDNLCLQGGTCSTGVCSGGTEKDCASFTDDCNAGTCDPTTGACGGSPTNEGGACQDFKGCTVASTCTMGVCDGPVTTVCANDDNCCAPGCTAANDDDCQAILLFGDDVNEIGWETYRHALTAAGRNWDEHNYGTLVAVPTAAALAAYDVVIMFDDNLTDYSDADHQVFADWLALGGKGLFAVGKDFLQDWATAPLGTGERNLFALLGVTYLGASAGTFVERIDGVSDDPITGPFFGAGNGITLSTDAFSSGDYVDQTLGPAAHVGLYAGGSGLGLTRSAISTNSPGTYKTVWMGVGWHNGLTSQNQRDLLMLNVLNWLKP